MHPVRDRADRCPGVLRPWPAEDGPLVRIRLCGGMLTRAQLEGLLALAPELHLTSRANLQVRGVADPVSFADALEGLGLLPSRTHDLVRNIVVAPDSDRMRAVAERFDTLLCADPELASLPGKFLFGFDEHGTLADQRCDLGLLGDRLVVDGRLGGPATLEDLLALAHRFLSLRGVGPTAAWHVRELPATLAPAEDPYPVAPRPAQLDVPDGVLTTSLPLPPYERAIVTPWRGLVLR